MFRAYGLGLYTLLQPHSFGSTMYLVSGAVKDCANSVMQASKGSKLQILSLRGLGLRAGIIHSRILI